MKKWFGFAATLVLLAVGCGNKQQAEEAYKIIVDDYANIMLRQDLDSAEYDGALSAVNSYLQKPDAETLQAARTKVQKTVSSMEEASAEITSYTMEKGFSDTLKEYGIEPEEYLMNADARADELADYVSTLKVLDEFLSYEETGDLTRDALRMEYQMTAETQDILRSYNYCGINYWFAGWGEEEVSYVKRKVHDHLQSFSAEQETWKDDRDAVEQRMTAYMNELEDVMEEWADYLGDYQEEIYQIQKDLESEE